MKDDRKKYIADSIRGVPDFPIKGINFHDVTTLLLDPQVTSLTSVCSSLSLILAETLSCRPSSGQ